MRIRARAPLRVSFAGGGTDVAPFPAEHGGHVLSATIDRYAYGSLDSRTDGQISIESVDYGMVLDWPVDRPPALDGKLDLAKAAIARLTRDAPGHGGHDGGFDIFLHSNAPPGSGLGSSSTVMVVLIGLLDAYLKLGLTEYEIAQLAFDLERNDLGIAGGRQDQYAATFGGFNFIEFEADRTIVNPLRIKDECINELEHNLLLCYTGVTRASGHIIDDQRDRYTGGEQGALDGLQMQKTLAVEMKNMLLKSQLDDFGRLLGDAWEHKKKMSPLITNPFIDELYEGAMSTGALGGKVTGAGGGGYILFYCDFRKRHAVARHLVKMGASVTDFAFEPRGVSTWRMR
jgi:D-glycero-alpha-D-manno-heptose-7-phosphate kinase